MRSLSPLGYRSFSIRSGRCWPASLAVPGWGAAWASSAIWSVRTRSTRLRHRMPSFRSRSALSPGSPAISTGRGGGAAGGGPWLITFTIASVVSTPLNFLISGGKSGVAVGDSIYATLNGLHVPRIIASLLGEAAIDLPDKLMTVVAALLITQGLPEPRLAPSSADLDLGEALTFVVRSDRWIRKLLAGAACLLFSWLIVPVLLLLGYTVEGARGVRAGARELPPWDRRWQKIKDGFKFLVAILIWTTPSVLLSIPSSLVSEQSAVSELAGIVSAAGSLWGLVVLVLEPAIISQYMDRGFPGALNPVAVIRRVRMNLALSIVVGALVVALSTISLIGIAALLVGVLVTFPYASYVAAYLAGQYARLTERPALRADQLAEDYTLPLRNCSVTRDA